MCGAEGRVRVRVGMWNSAWQRPHARASAWEKNIVLYREGAGGVNDRARAHAFDTVVVEQGRQGLQNLGEKNVEKIPGGQSEDHIGACGDLVMTTNVTSCRHDRGRTGDGGAMRPVGERRPRGAGVGQRGLPVNASGGACPGDAREPSIRAQHTVFIRRSPWILHHAAACHP